MSVRRQNDWGLTDDTKAFTFDMTAANSGRLNGVCALVEAKLAMVHCAWYAITTFMRLCLRKFFLLVWGLPRLQRSKFSGGLRNSGQILCTVTSVPGSETILYWLNWMLKLARWSKQLDMKHIRDDYWNEFCSSQHSGDMLQMYYHHVFVFAFFDVSLCC